MPIHGAMRYLFQFTGPISRGAFWQAHLWWLGLAIAWAAALVAGWAAGLFTLVIGVGVLIWLVTAVYGVLWAGALLVALAGLAAGRARDLGLSGWSALLLLVPGLNVGWWLYLACAPSKAAPCQTSSGENEFAGL